MGSPSSCVDLSSRFSKNRCLIFHTPFLVCPSRYPQFLSSEMPSRILGSWLPRLPGLFFRIQTPTSLGSKRYMKDDGDWYAEKAGPWVFPNEPWFWRPTSGTVSNHWGIGGQSTKKRRVSRKAGIE